MTITQKTVVLTLVLLFASFNDVDNKIMMNHYVKTMQEIYNSNDPLVIRTNFEKEVDWNKIKSELSATYELGFNAFVEFLDNPKYVDYSIEQIIIETQNNYNHDFIFVVDKLTFSNNEHTVLCIDLAVDKGKSFRVAPSAVWIVENNLTISNMDFEEFYLNCDKAGIFRGFK